MTERTGFDATTGAEPPGGGRQDHDVMREAATRPVTGPASTETLAASGGLQVPGREPHASPAASADADAGHGSASPVSTRHAHATASSLIPGERDPTTLTHREPGAIGGPLAGADIPAAAPPSSMHERTASEHAREGGAEGAAPKKRTTKKY